MKTLTAILRETLKKRDELRRIPYWRDQIPERCPPVLWFGDHKQEPRIVTVGLNPSHGEFFKSQDARAEVLCLLRAGPEESSVT